MTALDIVAAHYAAGKAGDLDGMIKDFADDIVWKESDGGPYAGTFTGAAEIVPAIFGRIAGEWQDFGAVLDYFIADEGTGNVAAVCNYVGTFKETGKAQNVRVVHLWQVRDGKIVSFEQVVDSAAQHAAMS